MLYGKLDERGVWGRINTCICMSESLCCPPETITALLFGYTPIQKKSLKKKSLDPVGEGEGGMFQENSIETCILSRVKQTTSPGWMHETRARTWCTGKTQRDRVERKVGGGIGMGKTCKLKDVSFQCMTKFTTN